MSTTIIVPAYNEERRIGPFLKSLASFTNKYPEDFEVIVVDDGSEDRTIEILQPFRDIFTDYKIISYHPNQGKGAAIKRGVEKAISDQIVFMDADGATSPFELPKMLSRLKNYDLAIGNRWLSESEVRSRTPIRSFSSWVYRNYMGIFGLKGIDTMCGFKGFNHEVAKDLFSDLQNPRWLFDPEICYKAKKKGYRISNFPIRWESKRGSKLSSKILAKSFFELPLVIYRAKKGLPRLF